MSGDRGLVDHSALTLRDQIATRAASPVEVLEAHLTEIARLNPALNAIVTLAGEQARAAEQAVMRGDTRGSRFRPLEPETVNMASGFNIGFEVPHSVAHGSQRVHI